MVEAVVVVVVDNRSLSWRCNKHRLTLTACHVDSMYLESAASAS